MKLLIFSNFSPFGENNGVTTSLNTLGNSTNNDTENFDNDENTDKYIPITQVDFNGKFLGEDLPASLSFSTSKEGVDLLTDESKE